MSILRCLVVSVITSQLLLSIKSAMNNTLSNEHHFVTEDTH